MFSRRAHSSRARATRVSVSQPSHAGLEGAGVSRERRLDGVEERGNARIEQALPHALLQGLQRLRRVGGAQTVNEGAKRA